MKSPLLHAALIATTLMIGLLAALVGFRPVLAGALSVTTTDDAGAGSLRQALLDANQSPGVDVIAFAVSGEISLDSTLPTIEDDLVIQGPGVDNLAISGAYLYRVFDIQAGAAVTITDLTVRNGRSPNTETGGGIRSAGDLHLARVHLHDNISVYEGGGLAVTWGTLSILDSTIQSNTGSYNGGVSITGADATISGSRIANNQGSGVRAYVATVAVSDTQIVSNTGAGVWGQQSSYTLFQTQVLSNADSGVQMSSGSLSAVKTEIADNRGDQGAGVRVDGGSANITDTLIVRNGARYGGGGVYVGAFSASVTVKGGEIAYNSAGEGAGVELLGGDLKIEDSHILSNTAQRGSAIYVQSMRDAVLVNNCIVNNADIAVELPSYLPYYLSAPNNWWGAPDGPSGSGPGHGDSVSERVIYSNFKTAAPAGCPTLRPDLRITKSVRPDFALPGQAITYTVVLSNTGSGDALGVVLTDDLPSGIQVVGWTQEPPEGAARSQQQVTWSGPLEAGSAITLSFAVTNTGAYNRVVTNTVEFAGDGQSGFALAPLALTTNPYYRNDPRPLISTERGRYDEGEKVRVTVSGMWPNRCTPEPNLGDYLDDPDPTRELPIIISDSGHSRYVQVELYELLVLRVEYQDAVSRGTAREFYAQTCGSEPTPWSYTFAGDSLPAGTYGTIISLSWKPLNPLNQYPQWSCIPDQYCYIATDERAFHIGKELFLPQVAR